MLSVILILAGCTKNADDPTINGLSDYYGLNLNNAKQVFTINAAIYNSIQGQKGTVVQISPNSFSDAQGNLVTGNVQFELVEIFSRSDMFRMNRTTQANHSSGDVRLLVSGGEYYINATQNGQPVFLNQNINVKVPCANSGQCDETMRKFNGVVQEDGSILWDIALDSVIPIDSINLDSTEFITGYGILEGEWGWTNVDRWYSDPRPKTTIFIDVPDGFNPTNTEVFLTYDGEATALAQMDTWVNDMFSEHYGLIPIGLECHVIAVTEIDGVLNYAIQGFTVVENHIEVIDGFTPTTQAELFTLINSLP